MSEAVNQNNQHNQKPTETDPKSSDSNDMMNFQKESEDEMKALAKGLMVDLVWTLSGMNRESREQDQEKNSQSTN